MTNDNRQVKGQIDQAASELKGVTNALTDEVIERENGCQQYVHHINGDPKNKLVIGSSRRGKSMINRAGKVVEFNPFPEAGEALETGLPPKN